MIGCEWHFPLHFSFYNQDEEDSDLDVEEGAGEEEGEGEGEDEKLSRNWSVLKSTPQLRKSKVL